MAASRAPSTTSYTLCFSSQVMFQAYGSKQGPLHNLLLSTPYVTKDHLQLKRFQAQTNGTTYVYDFPEMFRQGVQKMWKEYKEAGGTVAEPETLLSCVELVLDDRDQLCEMNRLPGENEVWETPSEKTIVIKL